MSEPREKTTTPPKDYSAEKARQGQIVLGFWGRRIWIAAAAGIVVLLLVTLAYG